MMHPISTRRHDCVAVWSRRSAPLLASAYFILGACTVADDSADTNTATNNTNSSGDTNADGTTQELGGIVRRVHLTDGLPVETAGDALSIYVPSATGGIIKTANIGPDGSFVVPGVPAGLYAIYSTQDGHPHFEFTAGDRNLDVATLERGRPDLERLAAGQFFDLGFRTNPIGAPTVLQDSQLRVASRGGDHELWLGFNADSVGQTLDLDRDPWGPIEDENLGLVSTDKGDRLLVAFYRTEIVDGGRCLIATDIARPSPAKIAADQENTIDLDFSPLEVETRDFIIDYEALHTLMRGLVPESRATYASAASYSVFGTDSLQALDFTSGCYREDDIPSSQRYRISTRDYMPAAESRVLNISLDYTTKLVRSTDSNSISNDFAVNFYVPLSLVDADGNVDLPLRTFARDIRVSASPDASSALPYGSTPTIEWDAPTDSQDLEYQITLSRYDGDGVETIASFVTQATSLTVPASVLSSHDFAVQIDTRNWHDSPSERTYPVDRIGSSIPTLWASSQIIGTDDDSTDTGTDTTSTDTTDSTGDETDTSTGSDTSTDTDSFPLVTVSGVAINHFIGDTSVKQAAAPSVVFEGLAETSFASSTAIPAADGGFSATLAAPLPWTARVDTGSFWIPAFTVRESPIDLGVIAEGRNDRKSHLGPYSLAIIAAGVRNTWPNDEVMAFSHGALMYASGELDDKKVTNIKNGVELPINSIANNSWARISAAAGDVLWLQYREAFMPAKGDATCRRVAYTASDTTIEVIESSLTEHTQPTFVAVSGPIAHTTASTNAFLAALQTANPDLTLTLSSSELATTVAPYDGRSWTRYSQSYCSYDTNQDMEADLPISNHWDPSWASLVTAKVSATATVPNGNHLKSLDLAITANRYDIPATGTFDVQLQPVGTGVREIRVDKSQFGSTNPQLVWDIPQGEQPVFYIVELIQNGMRYEIYRTTSPSLDLRPTRISANEEVLFLIHTYYGSIDPAHPLTSLKIEGSVPTLSRIFKGSELIATPKRESSYLPRRSAFDTVDAASGNQRKAVPRSKRQLGILGKTMGMP